MKKSVIGIFAGGTLLLMLLIGLIIIPEEKKGEQNVILIEQIASVQGILSTTSYYPRYENPTVYFFFEDKACGQSIKNALRPFRESFENLVIRKTDLLSELADITVPASVEIPFIVIRGNADIYDIKGSFVQSRDSYVRILSGKAACSEKIVQETLCSSLSKKPELCNQILYARRAVEITELHPADSLCYSSCLSDIVDEGVMITSYRQGPPCERVAEYVPGRSIIKGRECDGITCESSVVDKACCYQDQCVFASSCYDAFTLTDLNADGNNELCMSDDKIALWTNPDISQPICERAGMTWIDCTQGSCKYGIDDYDEKENGLCCGDDANEQALFCKGTLCQTASNSSMMCCPQDSCVYGSVCYAQGCNELSLQNGLKIQSYCENGVWKDLDESHCEECIGKNAWSGVICCGDDDGEGKYPVRFSYNDDNQTKVLFNEFCTNSPDSCIMPAKESEYLQGCFDFKQDEYLQGNYYCSNSIWNDLDNSSKFCEKCGFIWNADCCGDDLGEYYLKGNDGTSACCFSDLDLVVNSRCLSTENCGNDKLESAEQCESPYMDNNQFCVQNVEECFGRQYGFRDRYGSCNNACQCSEDSFAKSCSKGKCGATCSNDNDCAEGKVCDHTSCSCKEKTYCGDGIVQEKNAADWKEECELPDFLFNEFCDDTIQCFEPYTGIRPNLGACDSNCQCIYGSYQKMCIKGSCTAQCNQDGSGCPQGFTCNTDTCSCIRTDAVCGNNLCETSEEFSCISDCISKECPARIDFSFTKNSYLKDDSIEFTVTVLDKDGNTMGNIPFDLDILVNGNYIETESYETSEYGTYSQTRSAESSLLSGSYEYIAYIAKSYSEECKLVSDSGNALIMAPGANQNQINSSRFDLLYGFTSSLRQCGNNEIDPGEACEGTSVCRISLQCDYEARTYDLSESCIGCSCPQDARSEPDSEIYCANCQLHCGDGKVNCDEPCEQGLGISGRACFNNSVYERIDACNQCTWSDDGRENDVLISSCFCECPSDPGICNNGNWIEYKSSYFTGCKEGQCNACACTDLYLKDSNKDGIEDKCSLENCFNKKDDNDNGLIDIADPECSICDTCGIGLFNVCDVKECLGFEEQCYFSQELGRIGSCSSCKDTTCESYITEASCNTDSCSLRYCLWKNESCCTDTDTDGICDANDICPTIANTNQADSDYDKLGDACELCLFEPSLAYPPETNESICDDDIDNDCDTLLDCFDPDCIGNALCCMTASDCTQDACAIEECVENKCIALNRTVCDAAECPQGTACSLNGTCTNFDNDLLLCEQCSIQKNNTGNTPVYLQNKILLPNCCGDDDKEFYRKDTGSKLEACCDSMTDCVNSKGNCINTETFDSFMNQFCYHTAWYSCNRMERALCSEIGSTYRPGNSYISNGESNNFCIYTGKSWKFQSIFPKEVCNDGIDNDCDKEEDELDCVKND